MQKLADRNDETDPQSALIPRERFGLQQFYQTAYLLERKLRRKCLTYLHVREYLHNLAYLYDQFIERFGLDYSNLISSNLRSIILTLEQLTTHLERCSGVTPTDWIEVMQSFLTGTANVIELDRTSADTTPAPSVRMFTPVEITEAGVFGASYAALLGAGHGDVPVTFKIVNMFTVRYNHSLINATMFAEIVSSPWVCIQYCSFAALEAYVSVSEPFAGISLFRLVKTRGCIESPNNLKIILAQLAVAVQHIHYQGFIHRCIKPSCAQVNSRGLVKVCDFSKSRVCLGRFSSNKFRSYDRGTVAEFSDKSRVGSLNYMAPEMLQRKAYGRAADWWSFGVTAFSLATGRIPFKGNTYAEQKKAISIANYDWPRETCPGVTSKLRSLVKKCLVTRPQQRLCSASYRDLWRHTYFSGLDIDHLQFSEQLADMPVIDEIRATSRMTMENSQASISFEELIDNEEPNPLFTFTSPGFVRAIRKLSANEKISPEIIRDPVMFFSLDETCQYRFHDKAIRRASNSSKHLQQQPRSEESSSTTSSSSFQRLVGSEELPYNSDIKGHRTRPLSKKTTSGKATITAIKSLGPSVRAVSAGRSFLELVRKMESGMTSGSSSAPKRYSFSNPVSDKNTSTALASNIIRANDKRHRRGPKQKEAHAFTDRC
ncbi:microtubule-associated serine/threonine-protein kinase 1-like [Varroa jacobsoni]|uniref:microtubule-associated serine/threonine-protein kinase 1-like n=1 Tax=Varroa jacobsoni TaxID=62625 RepID=UPI000BF5F65E|nr:microtubule-associated serine/threonine-protein kinase 1-like [Varroa jacobsoni]